MTNHELFERLWNGTAPMEEWTAAVADGAVTEVTPDIITVHTTYFCGSVSAIRTGAGLVLVDTANRATAHTILARIRAWDKSPIHTVIYTHGHIDHTGGIGAIDREAAEAGRPRPRIVAHRDVARRQQRYLLTQGLNSVIQGQQFDSPDYVYPAGDREPDEVYDEAKALEVGGTRLDLFHGRGETDDATFVWLPRDRVLASGDFVIWMFPNAGNPRKVQRYAAEWAAALRRMETLQPATLIPGHGPVVFGQARVARILGDGALVLETLVRDALALMNRGANLDEVLHAVTALPALLALPWLRARYDDPEFLVRAIYHLYAGWFDGNEAHLKPAPEAELARELAALAGGAARLAERAGALADAGDTRLAVHLAAFAGAAAPDDQAVQALRARVLAAAIARESSLMGKAFLAVFERDAKRRAGSPLAPANPP